MLVEYTSIFFIKNTWLGVYSKCYCRRKRIKGDVNMTIAEVSKKLELSADTLRYYERIGLIPPVPRNKSGIRDYDENSIGWINFIKCMRKAGLPIEVLIEYVTLYQLGDSTKEVRKNLLIEQREELISKIEELKETLEYLNKKIERVYTIDIEKSIKTNY